MMLEVVGRRHGILQEYGGVKDEFFGDENYPKPFTSFSLDAPKYCGVETAWDDVAGLRVYFQWRYA